MDQKALQKQLQEWEARSPQTQQLQSIKDIGTVLEEFFIEFNKNKDQADKFGALLADIRNQLQALNSKEAAEMPDFSKPIVEAISKIESALQPEFKPNIKVAAPRVEVAAPDLSGVEKAMKAIPDAFKQAIQLIPQPVDDDTAVIEAIKELIPRLESIDTGTRMKPLPPSTIKTAAADGSLLGSAVNDIVFGSYTNGIPASITLKSGSTTLRTLTISQSGGNISEIVFT